MKITAREALNRYKSGKSLENVDIRGEDLSGNILKEVNLTAAKMSNTNFSNCDLSNSKINRPRQIYTGPTKQSL